MTFKHKITGTQAKLAEDGKYYIHNCSIGIPKQFIEGNRMWEKEDGYEILSFRINNKYMFPADENMMKAFQIGIGIMERYSIKRLNNNEVFSVGDKYVAYNGSVGSSINEFRLVRGEIYINCMNIPLEDIQKAKEIILTTKDGVELFGGDKCYIVSKDYLTIQYSEVDNKNIMYLPHFNLYFAKKENIEKYIKENKPQYSLNDIRNVLTKQMECTHWIMIDVDKIIKDLENER